jgi:hypothetical protein
MFFRWNITENIHKGQDEDRSEPELTRMVNRESRRDRRRDL